MWNTHKSAGGQDKRFSECVPKNQWLTFYFSSSEWPAHAKNYQAEISKLGTGSKIRTSKFWCFCFTYSSSVWFAENAIYIRCRLYPRTLKTHCKK